MLNNTFIETFPDDMYYKSTEESLASLRSSILDYRRENGRTYHKLSDGSERSLSTSLMFSRLSDVDTVIEYVLPNDEVHILGYAAPRSQSIY